MERKMQQTITKWVAILVFGVCISIGNTLPAGSYFPKMPGREFIAKGSRPKLKINFTSNSTVSTGALGKWRLIVATPHGKLFKSKHIHMQDATKARTFYIHSRLKQGRYTVFVYVTSRGNVTPVNLTTLMTNLVVKPSNRKDLFSIQTSVVQGNTASIVANDTAQVVYTLVSPS